ncbi:MAG: hypothetical protein WCI71_01465 [Bacteroidota bacterium]
MRLILNETVFPTITRFLEDPVRQKERFEEILFNHLDGLAISDDNLIDADHVCFFREINLILAGTMSYLQMQAEGGGGHE